MGLFGKDKALAPVRLDDEISEIKFTTKGERDPKNPDAVMATALVTLEDNQRDGVHPQAMLLGSYNEKTGKFEVRGIQFLEDSNSGPQLTNVVPIAQPVELDVKSKGFLGGLFGRGEKVAMVGDHREWLDSKLTAADDRLRHHAGGHSHEHGHGEGKPDMKQLAALAKNVDVKGAGPGGLPEEAHGEVAAAASKGFGLLG